VVTNGHDFHARMFAPHLGIGEDPATGSAAAAFSAVVRRFDRPADGEHKLSSSRDSRWAAEPIELEIIIEKGKLTGGRIGGEAVIVGRGELYV
jgi:Predicted epimerase, PhzC/PhzF homolog